MSKKKPILERKKPFNISIRAGLILSFKEQCLFDDVNHNDLIESLMEDYLQKRYYEQKDKKK